MEQNGKAIFFDIDNTLLDDAFAVKSACKIIFREHYSLKYSFDLFLSDWFKAITKYFPLYLSGQISFEEQRVLRIKEVFALNHSSTDECIKIFNKYLDSYESNWTLFKEIDSTLMDLFPKYKLGIISNGQPHQQKKKLKATKLNHYFSTIVISGATKYKKPDHQIFKLAANELKISLKDCFYVGDKYETDYLGAINAGMQGIWLNRGLKTTDKIENEINSLLEVAEIITKVTSANKS